jgi:hypothetical protein
MVVLKSIATLPDYDKVVHVVSKLLHDAKLPPPKIIEVLISTYSLTHRPSATDSFGSITFSVRVQIRKICASQLALRPSRDSSSQNAQLGIQEYSGWA